MEQALNDSKSRRDASFPEKEMHPVNNVAFSFEGILIYMNMNILFCQMDDWRMKKTTVLDYFIKKCHDSI
jgi:hypothetical protein